VDDPVVALRQSVADRDRRDVDLVDVGEKDFSKR
jgi:hypothetical protein